MGNTNNRRVHDGPAQKEIMKTKVSTYAPIRSSEDTQKEQGNHDGPDEKEITKIKVSTYAPVRSMDDIQIGDHIAWWKIAIWHHAIVTDIHASKRITVIHYNAFGSKNPFNKAKVQEEEIDLEKQWGILYKVVYDGSCLPPHKVIERARDRIGEEEYNILTANCEHFATHCKVGKASCIQVKQAAETAGNTFHDVAIAAELKALNFIAKTSEDDGVAVEAANIANTLGIVSNIMGPLGIFFAESFIYGIKMYTVYKSYKLGHIDKRELITKALVLAAMALVRGGCAICGIFLGQVLIPIPFVGAFVGGLIGALIGQGLGMLAEWGITKLRSKKI